MYRKGRPILWLSILFFCFIFTGSVSAQTEHSVIVQYHSLQEKQQIEQLAREVLYDYDTLDMLSIRVSAANLRTLEQAKQFKIIEETQQFQLQAQAQFKVANNNFTEKDQWNLKAIDAPAAWNSGYTGRDVKVAIIDSGITTHADLKIAGGISFVGDSYTDGHGHGTHIAGIIAAQHNDFGVAGIVPNATVYAVKAIGDDGYGDIEDVIAGIDWAIKENIHIINLSFGDVEYSAALHEAIKRAKQAGILIVAASGNEGNDYGTGNTMIYPAQHEEVIAVTAVGKSLVRSSFSSTGPLNDFAAPGEEIYSTYLNGQYATYQGTSLAAPHITGLFAILMEQFPYLDNTGLYEAMKRYTKDLGQVGFDELYGFGLPQFQQSIHTTELSEKNAEARKILEAGIAAFIKNPTAEQYAIVMGKLNSIRDVDFKATNKKLIDNKVANLTKNAEKVLIAFEKKPSTTTYKKAEEALNKLPQTAQKQQFEERLQEGLLVLAKSAITKLERYEASKTKSHHTQARFEIQRLPNSTLKTELLQRLNR